MKRGGLDHAPAAFHAREGSNLMQAVTHAALGLAFVVAAGGWGWVVLTCFGRVNASQQWDRRSQANMQ